MTTTQLNICALAPFLHQLAAVMQKKHFFGALWDKFALQLKSFMLEMHLLKVLFETNLVSKISTKALKEAPFIMPNFM